MSSDEWQRRVSRRVTRGFDPEALTELRKDRKITRAELARTSGVGESTLHHWEHGTRSPQVDLLAKVMAQLKSPISAVVKVSAGKEYPGDLRVRAGLTQPQLGLEASVGTATITRIERGVIGLSQDVCERVASALKVTPEEYRDAFDRARTRPAGTKV